MTDAVYRDYDSEALYAQYNNRAQITEEALNALKEDQNVRSAAYRNGPGRKHLDVAYGPHERERLDVFLPASDGAPLFAYIHGGYWQWNDKEGNEFLAKELNAAGAAFANIEYALCPAVTLPELSDQCRRAMAHLWREADTYGYDRNRIVVSGHSAGGHLTAMMQATDWPSFEAGLPSHLVAASLPISGVYDVEPIRLTPLNDAVRLTPEDVPGQSPMFMNPPSKGDLAAAWAKHGVPTSTLNMPGRDHFSALSALAETDHALFAAALKLLGLK